MNLCYFLVVAALVIPVLVVVVGVSDKLIKNIIITYLSSRTEGRTKAMQPDARPLCRR